MLRVQTRVEERPYVVIVPYLEWKPSPAWTIRTDYGEGAGLEATFRLDDAWALQSRAVYNERRFRLDEDAIRPEGIFQDARFTVMVGIRWQPTPDLTVAL